MAKKDIYHRICDEIITMCKLCHEFSLIEFIEDEKIDVKDEKAFLAALIQRRELLELDNHIICEDEEMEKIMEEGLHIHRIIAKEQLYGKD